MSEWFKKYLGWLGFFTWTTCTLLFILDEFFIKISILNEEFLFIGFLMMAGAQTIQDILNQKYFTKYSQKVKIAIIVFIIIIIGFSFFIFK